MSTIGTGFTMADIARRQGGYQPVLVDALTSPRGGVVWGRLPMKQVIGWSEPFTRIEGRPTVAFRRLGEYLSPSKSSRNPYSEGIFLCSGSSKADKIKADRDPRGPGPYRVEEAWSFLEAMGYAASNQLFYGDKSTSDGFDGIYVRTGSSYATYVDAGGVTSALSTCCSLYGFILGPGQFMGLYNVGAKGDLIEANDYGAMVDVNSSSAENEVYRTFFNAAIGIAQYHPKSIGRLAGVSSGHKPTADLMTSLYSAMDGKPTLLATTWLGWGYLSALLSAKQVYAPGQVDYSPYVGSYDGIPIIVDTALVDTESA